MKQKAEVTTLIVKHDIATVVKHDIATSVE